MFECANVEIEHRSHVNDRDLPRWSPPRTPSGVISVIHPLLRRQLGLINRSQATELGLRDGHLERLIDTGVLERVHEGVFRHTAVAPSYEQRLMAGLLAAGPTSVVSHRSAAFIWGVPNLAVALVELSRPGSAPVRRAGLHVHRITPLDDLDRTGRDGLAITAPARTIIDLASVVSAGLTRRALETWLSTGTLSFTELEGALARAGRRRGSGVVRGLLVDRALGLDAPDSPAERILAETLVEGGLPKPEHHHVVHLDNGVRYELDWAYPHRMLALELDGYGVHLASFEVFDHDRWRRNELEIAGWTILNFTSAACRRHPDRVVGQVRRLLRPSPNRAA